MIKRLLIGLMFGLVVRADAGLITRTYTYTSGNTISANEHNTNENTLYNEVNGNISTANILDGTIQNGDMADTQLVVSKFASSVQSTFTYVNTLGAYRRPVLKWISITTVDVEANTGTSNETCIQFPDQRRCVTENTGSTSVNRRFIITEAAAVSGTKNSGLYTGESEGNNVWYSMYAVKTTDVGTDFVLVGTTITPTQGNFATLNTNLGTNSWVYLGLIRNGNGGTSQGDAIADIVSFIQVGNVTIFQNSNAGGHVAAATGISLTGSAGSTTLNYSYVAGISGPTIPSHINIGLWTCQKAITAGELTMNLGGAAQMRFTPSAGISHLTTWGPAINGVNCISGNSVAGDVNFVGWIDSVLGVGFNPQL